MAGSGDQPDRVPGAPAGAPLEGAERGHPCPAVSYFSREGSKPDGRNRLRRVRYTRARPEGRVPSTRKANTSKVGGGKQ